MARRVRNQAWVCGVAALLAIASPLHAQGGGEASDGARSAELEALLERGIALRREGKDAEALEVFRRAVQVDPESARAQAQLGVTNQALGRWVQADTYLAEALSHTQDPYIARYRDALERAHQVVQDHIGTLQVDGGPAGATVALNGRVVGTLPVREPLKVAVGSYLLEVSLQDHYSVTRPVSVNKRMLTRETVELVPFGAGAAPAVAAGATGGDGVALGGGSARDSAERDSGGSVPRWLPWALGGASAASAVVATWGWVEREDNARRWNDDRRCLNIVNVSRETLCGDVRESGERAQTIAIVSSGAAVAFAAGAIWAALAGEPESEREVGLTACSLGHQGLACSGRF